MSVVGQYQTSGNDSAMKCDTSQSEEWELIYKELRATLVAYGREDAFGTGDFWLVDDNYGSPQHKVCVTKVSFLTRPLAAEIQRLIRKYSLPWEVLFSLDVLDARRNPADCGLTVRKADIEECWNAERMAESFGIEFRWNPAIAADQSTNRK